MVNCYPILSNNSGKLLRHVFYHKRKRELKHSKSCPIPHRWLRGTGQALEARLPHLKDFKSMVEIDGRFPLKMILTG